MHEQFLSYIWRHRRFRADALTTTAGQSIEILQAGELNTDSGPDFANARIRIDDTLWAGSVELHVRSSDWQRHKHSTDRAYDNTILHVVFDADVEIPDQNGQPLACLALRDRIDPSLEARYLDLVSGERTVPCAAHLAALPSVVWHGWLDRLLVERLEAKTDAIKRMVAAAHNSWDEAFYHALARNFGQKVNADPFEALARSLPVQILAKHKSQLFQIEALLFGQAGMLNDQLDEPYPESLRKEYHFLRQKYQLTPIDAVQWKYFRMRPAGFPTVRIAQFAALVYQSSHLFSKCMEAENMRQIEHLFKAEVSEYWRSHYRFGTEQAKQTAKPITRDLVQLIVYNTILPFWFLYGAERHIPDLQRRALGCFDDMRPESNHILDAWAEAGKKATNAAQAQALIQLRTQYCDRKLCTKCAVGAQILR